MKSKYITKKIKDCVEPVSRKDIILSSAYLKSGMYPIIDQGQDFISGYTNNKILLHENLGEVIIFGDHTRAVKFIDFPFVVGADGTKILKPIKEVYPKYFYYNIVSLDLESRGYARHFSKLKEIKIPLPPLTTQKQIVADLDAKFAKLKQMKLARASAIANTEKVLSQTLSEVFAEGKEKGWEEKMIGDMCLINPIKSEVKDYNEDTLISFVQMKSVSEVTQSIEMEESKKLKDVQGSYTYFRKGDILFAKVTPCMENGKVAIADNIKNNIGFGSSEFHILRADEKILLPKYVYNIIRSKYFRELAQNEMTGSSGLKRVPKSFIENFKIQVPSLKEQKEIVERLDELSEKLKRLKELQKEQLEDMKKLEKAYLSEVFEG